MRGIPRAQRFPIAIRVLWRSRGETKWLEAVSLNASGTGVLFQSDRLHPVGTEVELIFTLSWETVAPVDLADVIALGQIVRVETSCADATQLALAAKIDCHSFIGEP